jgi:enamine deaminase RidA (YjgF/YER057c/UK114 family)
MDIQHINPSGVHKPTGYTHVVKVSGGDLLIISGQVAVDAKGNLVGKDDLGSQTAQVFENIKAILASFNADFKSVVKLNTYIVNYHVDNRPILADVRNRYIDQDHPPASTLIGVQSLAAPHFMIEVEAMAVINDNG